MERDAKRQDMVSEQERAPAKVRDEEERIARKLKEEIVRIRAMHEKRRWSASTASVRKAKSGSEVWEGEWVVLKLIDFIIWLGLAFKILMTLF